uniref:Phage Tail Collar Domain n=1 Tax=Candidatus Kentrum sp. DK TaxID=2126562 RepID=A0A450SYP0_9GAMM|nr:MAG: hypothetical protein BECKDK2373B_GA0170837_10825 [Candidatus Kentron sp. DK]
MKKNISLFLPFLTLLFSLFSTPALAATPLDYCDRQLEQEIKSTYNLENLDQYRAHLREVLKYSREVLQGYVEADDGAIPVPVPIVRDVLLAEGANQETRQLLDTLRIRYALSPDLPLSDKDFEDFASRVLEGSIVAAWTQCRTICTECLADVHGKQNGILYRIHGDEHDVFAVTLTYLPERKTDPVSVMVTGVTVTGGASLNAPTVIRRGVNLMRYNGYTQTFARTEPREDVTIRVDFDGREGVQIHVSDRKPAAGLPVGTIVSSILPWEKYAETTGDTAPYHPLQNYWAPCDGRSIAGSRLQESTGKTEAPDMRGVFLRGMNDFAADGLGTALDKPRDPEPGREAGGEVQGDNVGKHEHKFRGGGARGTGNAEKGNDIHYVWYGEHDPGQSKERGTEKGPTGETRPKNVAVHYYVKIN